MAFLALSPLQHLQGKPFLCQYAPNKIKSMNKVLRSSTVVSPTAMFGLRHPPYELNALEPFMSKHTLETHWGKHQRGYVDNLNKQIEGSYLQGYTLEDLIKTTYSNGNPMPPFNNAAQVWNHNFFWESMQPEGGGECEGPIKMFIERDFGSYEDFLEEFKNNANSLFGSGWIWFSVSVKDRKLVVEKTKNAINPMIWNHIPLLTVDVWEHAYYLDYQNRRGDYVSTFFEHLVSWETVNDRFGRALSFANFGEPLIPEL